MRNPETGAAALLRTAEDERLHLNVIPLNVNDAHACKGTGSSFPDMLEADWDLMYDVHVKGTVFLTQEVVRRVTTLNKEPTPKSCEWTRIQDVCLRGYHSTKLDKSLCCLKNHTLS